MSVTNLVTQHEDGGIGDVIMFTSLLNTLQEECNMILTEGN